MSAELLREAAALMRVRAEAATDGGWRIADLAGGSWHPAVVLVVADWIDSHAGDLARADGHLSSCDSPGDVQQALAVARAYLGGTR